MSLDFDLIGPNVVETVVCGECARLYDKTSCETLFTCNITHNLSRMAREAGIEKYLWDANGMIARDLIEPLAKGLSHLRAHPGHYRQFDAPNGWGRYEYFVPFVANVLKACREHPDARVEVSR